MSLELRATIPFESTSRVVDLVSEKGTDMQSIIGGDQRCVDADFGTGTLLMEELGSFCT